MKREQENKKIKTVDFYCKHCKKSFHAFHVVTGDDSTPVMANHGMKCIHCTRVVILKKYTEKELMDHLENGVCYI